MTVEFLEFWARLIATLRLTTLAALVLIVVTQIMYLFWLNISAGRTGGERRRRLPNAPIMPTDPGAVDLTYGPEGSRSGRSAPDLAPSDSAVVRPKMLVLNGLPNVSEIDLPADQFGVGRFYNPEHDILVALDERSVSRRHAYISKEGPGEYYLADMKSSYGTSLRRGEDFQPLTPKEPVRVYHDDVVQFGSVVTVRLVLPGDTRAYATQV